MRPAATIFAAFLVCPALLAQNSVSVEGTVIDRMTGLGIADATVHFRSGNKPDYEAATDPSGHFRISGMEDGQYGVRVEKKGYVSEDSAAGDAALKIVRVSAGQEPEHIRAELATYARLRGRVLDPQGEPLADVAVTYSHGLEVLSSARQVTDDKGQFEFSNVVPGSYLVEAIPIVRSASPRGEASAGERFELQPTWYPAAIERRQAEWVVARDGADLAGYDIKMQASPVYRVRGVLLGEDGKPVSGAIVTDQSETEEAIQFGLALPKPDQLRSLSFFTLSRAGGQTSELTRTHADGSFEFRSVPRGLRQFRVMQITPGSGLRPPAVVTAVVDHDIDDLEIRLLPTFAVEGMTELDGVPADRMPAAVRDAFVEINGAGPLMAFLKRSGNGFRFERVTAGAIRIAAAPGLAGGYYLESVSAGGQDLTWKRVNVQAGTAPIRVVYKPNAGTITGTVKSANGAMIVLIPRAALDALDVQYGRIVRRSAGGTFEIDSVGPGSYYAFAVDEVNPEMFSNAADARKVVSVAAVVQVTEGATVTVKVKAVRFDD